MIYANNLNDDSNNNLLFCSFENDQNVSVLANYFTKYFVLECAYPVISYSILHGELVIPP